MSKEVNLLQEALHGMEEDKVSGECPQAVTVCVVTLKMDTFWIVMVFFLAVYVFGSCFRTLAVVIVLNVFLIFIV